MGCLLGILGFQRGLFWDCSYTLNSNTLQCLNFGVEELKLERIRKLQDPLLELGIAPRNCDCISNSQESFKALNFLLILNSANFEPLHVDRGLPNLIGIGFQLRNPTKLNWVHESKK